MKKKQQTFQNQLNIDFALFALFFFSVLSSFSGSAQKIIYQSIDQKAALVASTTRFLQISFFLLFDNLGLQANQKCKINYENFGGEKKRVDAGRLRVKETLFSLTEQTYRHEKNRPTEC